MEYSKHFQKVYDYYKKGLWNKARVREAVVKGWITPEEYTIITNDPWEE